jgi:hypothetical protein
MLSRSLRRLRPRSVYDVCAALALFVALGGTAYAVNTVNSTDIVDGQVKSVDVGDGEIKSADVKDQSLTTFDVSTFLGADIVDGTLTDRDVGDFVSTNFTAQVPALANGQCTFVQLGSHDYRGDHLLLTTVDFLPILGMDVDQVHPDYEVLAPPVGGTKTNAKIQVCNNQNGGSTPAYDEHFNLLVFKGT